MLHKRAALDVGLVANCLTKSFVPLLCPRIQLDLCRPEVCRSCLNWFRCMERSSRAPLLPRALLRKSDEEVIIIFFCEQTTTTTTTAAGGGGGEVEDDLPACLASSTTMMMGPADLSSSGEEDYSTAGCVQLDSRLCNWRQHCNQNTIICYLPCNNQRPIGSSIFNPRGLE